MTLLANILKRRFLYAEFTGLTGTFLRRHRETVSINPRTYKTPSAALVFLFSCFACHTVCYADTFKQKNGDKLYHGYLLQNTDPGKMTVMTAESGKIDIVLSDFDVTPDDQGRNKFISIITIDDQIYSDFLTSAFEKTIFEESNKGPLFIIVEINSPGGRSDLAMRLCSAITKTNNCITAAYIKNGDFGGARGAAAFVAMACRKVYISSATSIGGIYDQMTDKIGLEPQTGLPSPPSYNTYDSNWKNYILALAEKNHRPPLFLKAMQDRDVEILKIKREDNTLIIDAIEKQDKDVVLERISRMNNGWRSHLTLTANQAVEFGVADKAVVEFQEILTLHNAIDAKIEYPDTLAKAKKEFDKILTRFKTTYSDIKAKRNSISGYRYMREKEDLGGKVKELKNLSQQCKLLVQMTVKYPDFSSMNKELSSLQTEFDTAYETVKKQQAAELNRQRNDALDAMKPGQYNKRQR